MFARVSRYEVAPERMDDAIEGFRAVAADLTEIDGAKGGYVLVDRDEGMAVTITLWENAAALDASNTRAATLRRRAMESSGGSVESVQRLEVAVEFGS
jgi:heme-degrading monooxygenase HmoA